MVAVRQDSVRVKIASHSLETGLCGRFSSPCGNKSFRAAIFPSVRAKIHPCGHFSICAGKTT